MAFSFSFGGKTWWVARSISGYVTRAFEDGVGAEAKADYVADHIDEMIFYNQPVSSDFLSAGMVEKNIPNRWRLLGIKTVGSEDILCYLFCNTWGRFQKKAHDSPSSALLWLTTQKEKQEAQLSSDLPHLN